MLPIPKGVTNEKSNAKQQSFSFFGEWCGFIYPACQLFVISESFKRTERMLRDVTLYDTSVTSYKVKSNTIVNTNGYFLDKATNLKFKATIQDKLYRDFQEGKSKPIDIQREFNLDEIENSSDGPLLKFLGSVLIILLVGSAGAVIIINRSSTHRITQENV